MQRVFNSFLFVSTLLCITSSIASAELVGYWPLDEGSGDTAADMSGAGNDGMIFNTTTGGLGDGGSAWVNDSVRGSVLGFDGSETGAYVRAGSIPAMDLTNEFTWSFWANQSPDNTQPNNIVFGNRNNGDGADFTPRQFIKFTPTKFEWHTEGNGDDNLDYTDLSEFAGEWHHHTVVKAGANLTYYMNGEVASEGMITQALPDAMPLFFGGDNQGSDNENWSGLIDDIRIYNHALSGADVANLVPEPSSSVLLLFGAGMMLMFRRKQK